MKLLKKLHPPFLQKLDHYLLVNHRLIWLTKLHYVLFYVPLWVAFTTALSFLYPISLKLNIPEPALFFIATLIPTVVGFLFWFYKQSLHNIEKSNGNRFRMMEQSHALICFCVVVLFSIAPISSFFISQYRIAHLISAEEMKADIEILNEGNVYFPTEDYGDNIFNTINSTELNEDYIYFTKYFSTYRRVDVDSKSALVFYKNALRKENKNDIIQSYLLLMSKYGNQLKMSVTTINDNFNSKYSYYPNYFFKEKLKAKFRSINHSKNFLEHKLPHNLADMLKGLLVFTLCLTTLLQVYKNVSLRDFIIGSIGTILVLISVSFFGSFLNQFFHFTTSKSEVTLFTFLAYFGVAFYTASKIRSLHSSSRIHSFLLVSSNLISPFVLLMLAGLFNVSMGDDSVLLSIILTSMVVHYALMLPAFRALYVRQSVLPLAS